MKSKSVSRSALPHSLRSHELHAAHQAPLSMASSRQGYWNGLLFPSPGDLPNLGTEPGSPALADRVQFIPSFYRVAFE